MKTIFCFIFLVLFNTIISAQKTKRLTPKHPHEISVGYDNLFNFQFNGASLGYNYNWLPRKRFYVLTGASLQVLLGHYPCAPNQLGLVVSPDLNIRAGYVFRPWFRWDIGTSLLLGFYFHRISTSPSFILGKQRRLILSLSFGITRKKDMYDCRPIFPARTNDVVLKPYTSLGLNMTYKL